MSETLHIEGLDSNQDYDLYDDTPPGAIITKFSVVSEVMPYLSDQSGTEVRRNFVYVRRIFELGRSEYFRRIRDKVEFDNETQKWKILKLAAGGLSDIKRNPNEWNAFMRGATAEPTGIPLSNLFRNDPSRVAFYESHHIKTIEQLESLNHTDRQTLGMGVVDDCAKAEAHLAKIRAAAPALELNNKLAEKDRQIESLQLHLTEMNAKLNQLLTAQLEDVQSGRRKPGRVAKQDLEEVL